MQRFAMKLPNETYRRAFHASSIPMTISTREEGRYLDINQAALKLMGLPSNQVIGRTSLDLGVYTDRSDRDRIVGLLSGDHSSCCHELDMKAPDGSPLKMLIYHDLLGEGSTVWLTSGVDITPLRDAEAARERLRVELENARIINQREEERIAIARDLHDDLSQELAGLNIELASLARTSTDPDTRERLTFIKEQMGRTIGSVRTILSELRSKVLEELSLKGAVEWLTGNFYGKSGISCRLVWDTSVKSLAPAMANTIYRIIQEALNNIARHSKATETEVTVSSAPEALSVVVRDNGIGFDMSRTAMHGHYGITGMRERARLMGGSLDISGIPGQGTVITLELPLKDDI